MVWCCDQITSTSSSPQKLLDFKKTFDKFILTGPGLVYSLWKVYCISLTYVSNCVFLLPIQLSFQIEHCNVAEVIFLASKTYSMKFDDNSELHKAKGIQLKRNLDNIKFDNLKKLVGDPLLFQRCDNSGFIKYGSLLVTYECRRDLQVLYMKRVLEPGFVTTRSIDMQAKEDGAKPAKRGRPKGNKTAEERKDEGAKRHRINRLKKKQRDALALERDSPSSSSSS